jgi:hypothetical protein
MAKPAPAIPQLMMLESPFPTLAMLTDGRVPQLEVVARAGRGDGEPANQLLNQSKTPITFLVRIRIFSTTIDGNYFSPVRMDGTPNYCNSRTAAASFSRLCVARVPNNGRNFECLSGEEPYLGFELVQPVIKGAHTRDIDQVGWKTMTDRSGE